MKVRNGFVSNSSSSSFVCDVCGLSETGYDLTLREAEMFECVNGHTCCGEEALKDFSDPYDVSSDACPICCFQESSKVDLMAYLKATTTHTEESIFDEIKALNKRRKVLKPHEYVAAVLMKTGQNERELLDMLKAKYGTYEAFRKDIKE